MNETTTEKVARLRAELNAAEQVVKAEKQIAMDAVQPRYEFLVAPVTDNFDRVYDDSVVKYRIEGIVKNMTELEAAGHTRVHSGGMTYLYNTLSGKFITTVSGGSYYVPTELNPEFLGEVGEFVKQNPKGGDITEIVERYRHKGNKSWI